MLPSVWAVAGVLAPASSTAGSMVSAAPATMAAGHTRPLVVAPSSDPPMAANATGDRRRQPGGTTEGSGSTAGTVTGAGKVTAGGFGPNGVPATAAVRWR